MSLTPRARRACVCALTLAAAGCQDYNFNPVGRCLIQPGTKRVTLSNVSSADVLFVVDDSRSMEGEQAELASNFSSFIGNLDNANAARRKAGREPFDFHVAVTTTSMFWNYQTNARPQGPYSCSNTCADAPGSPVCCRLDNKAARMPMRCTSNAECTGTNVTCGPNCISPFTGEAALKGENYCCVQGATTPATAYPSGYVGQTIPCSVLGTECGTFEKHYAFASCSAGLAVDGWPYPQGDFVSYASGATVNPRVLHFDKSLYPAPPSSTSTLNTSCAGAGDCAPTGETCVAAISASGAPRFCRATCTTTCGSGFSCVAGACQPVNTQGFTSQALVDFFAGNPAGTNGNVIVGTCGSGEETSLLAAEQAIKNARDGKQKDTYDRTGTKTWNDATRTASSPADWFSSSGTSKLVVVFVGDEDDCSPKAVDASGAVVWDSSDYALGVDSCWYDKSRDAPLGQKQLAVDSFVSFFTGLGRPVGAGFIFPANDNVCSLATCTATVPQSRCCPAGGCTETTGAQGAGPRLLEAAHQLASSGADVVAGSICDPSFGTILNDIAEIVKPPSGLTLPSLPAADEVTMLRIAYASGNTRKVCAGPLAPRAGTNYTQAQAEATGVDWWFTETGDPAPPAAKLDGSLKVTTFVYINPSGKCLANPGETYSADYIGRVPDGGCWDDSRYTRLGGETYGDAMCRGVLGGTAESWTCFAEGATANACGTPTAAAPGTCICGKRADTCGAP